MGLVHWDEYVRSPLGSNDKRNCRMQIYLVYKLKQTEKMSERKFQSHGIVARWKRSIDFII